MPKAAACTQERMEQHVEDWLRSQLSYRFAEVSAGPVVLTAAAEQQLAHLPWVAVFHAGRQAYSSLNGFDQHCPRDATSGSFAPARPAGPARGRRQARFANLVASWRLQGSFVTNWCDAAGWDYAARAPALAGVPVLQHVRRRAQREQVVLMPLDRAFMGAGGENMQRWQDEPAFADKQDKLCWRGRLCGVSGDWQGSLYWAEGLLRPDARTTPEDELRRLREVPRVRICERLRGKPWADAGLVLSADEHALLRAQPHKRELLGPLLRERLSPSEQVRCKFILAVPGNDYPSGLYWALLSGSVVFRVEYDWETALDAGLEPWKHYVPVAADGSDIEEKFERMLARPQECCEIVRNAHELLCRQLDHDLRDALDYETLRGYERRVVPLSGLDLRWSLSRR